MKLARGAVEAEALRGLLNQNLCRYLGHAVESTIQRHAKIALGTLRNRCGCVGLRALRLQHSRNIGATKCRASTFLRLLNDGRRNEACGEITRWIRDGGRDCRIRANGCAGQVDRRMQEDELCLVGAAP